MGKVQNLDPVLWVVRIYEWSIGKHLSSELERELGTTKPGLD